MARFEKMIPFILFQEEGLKDEQLLLPVERMFAVAKAKGVHKHPNDSGGYTSCGVTLATYYMYRRGKGIGVTTVNDLARMHFAEWVDILKGMFWDKWRADEIASEMVAVALVDWAWVSGGNGIIYPQKLLGVKADGKVGPKTLAAVNHYPDQHELFDRIQAARNAYHASISKPGTKNAVFLNGWNNRVIRIQWDGFHYNAKAK